MKSTAAAKDTRKSTEAMRSPLRAPRGSGNLTSADVIGSTLAGGAPSMESAPMEGGVPMTRRGTRSSSLWSMSFGFSVMVDLTLLGGDPDGG